MREKQEKWHHPPRQWARPTKIVRRHVALSAHHHGEQPLFGHTPRLSFTDNPNQRSLYKTTMVASLSTKDCFFQDTAMDTVLLLHLCIHVTDTTNGRFTCDTLCLCHEQLMYIHIYSIRECWCRCYQRKAFIQSWRRGHRRIEWRMSPLPFV